jgi:DNA-binding transcriptional MerR regulator
MSDIALWPLCTPFEEIPRIDENYNEQSPLYIDVGLMFTMTKGGVEVKIKEVADKLNLSPRAIRLYEAKGLLSPTKQVDNLYRTFTEKDIWKLQTIISLRESGMSLKDIKQALENLDEDNTEELQYYLELQRTVMMSEWLQMKQVIGRNREFSCEVHRTGDLHVGRRSVQGNAAAVPQETPRPRNEIGQLPRSSLPRRTVRFCRIELRLSPFNP